MRQLRWCQIQMESKEEQRYGNAKCILWSEVTHLIDLRIESKPIISYGTKRASLRTNCYQHGTGIGCRRSAKSKLRSSRYADGCCVYGTCSLVGSDELSCAKSRLAQP